MISVDNTELHELTVDHGPEQIHHVHIGYVTASTTFDVDDSVVQDCHHTGHASSASISWAFVASDTQPQRFDNINSFALQDFALQDVVENRLRPPIA